MSDTTGMMERLHYLLKICQVKGVKMVVFALFDLPLSYSSVYLVNILVSCSRECEDEQNDISRVDDHFQEKYIKSVTCLEYHAKYIISTNVYLVQN
jgi:hypothetical protein